ncbi:putative oxidorectuctase [Hordeum vulgare]|nr:putative oxidorectuctase [Hordeum vulgare]
MRAPRAGDLLGPRHAGLPHRLQRPLHPHPHQIQPCLRPAPSATASSSVGSAAPSPYCALLRVALFGPDTPDRLASSAAASSSSSPVGSPVGGNIFLRVVSLQAGKSASGASVDANGKFVVKVEKRAVDFVDYISVNYVLVATCSSQQGHFKDEFVTAGGVPLSEISLSTMESKKQPNLFFAGEVLNVDGSPADSTFR